MQVVSSGGGSVSLSPSFTSSSTTQCVTGNSFTFTNTTPSAPIGTTYSWNFGDSTTSSNTNPTHTYTSAGYYHITLTATYNGQVFSASNQTVYVGPLPVANFASYHNGGLTFTFNSTSSVGVSGYITGYAWSFGDGGTATTSNPQHTYALAGVYSVKLIVTTNAGCVDSITTSITACPSVTAAFSVTSSTDQCLTGNSFTFANSSTNNAGLPASAMSYVWYFGDGTTSTSQTPPAHIYSVWGDYDVKLVATLTVGGCTVSDSSLHIKALSVEPMPVASYRLILDNVPYTPTALLSDTTKRCWRYGYDFSYQSSSTLAHGQMDYFWHFGTSALYFRDGDSSHYINPRIVFDTAGTYPVKLVVV
ncbi:MAG: PKD domain-containing protein, partial [Bacteroidetes bacterium]|nr:PKD domain-containing protein [Bacteroidota bacterium]